MAVPNYTEDLTDIDLAESASTGWTAFNISGGGGGTPAFGADFGMQGAGCWDKAASNAERGLAVNKTPGAGTVAAGVHIFVWGFTATPGVCDTLQNRGAYVIIGTGTSDFMQFHVEGSNTFGSGGRVGKCYPVDYVTTSNTGSVPYRTVNGSPGATPTYFGFGLKTLATVKGSNMGCDAVRYGTGAYITAGEVANPATFPGFAAQSDDINNRWGILSAIGAGYELQGRFVIGQNNAGTATLAYFEDTDQSISFVDTPHAAADFTQVIVDHASTTCLLTNISFTALGTINRGRFIVNAADPTVTIVGGTWTGIGIVTLQSNTTLDGTVLRQTDVITLNSATMDNVLVDKNRASEAVIATNLNQMTDCVFVSDGTGHAVDLGTVSTTTSMTWANDDSGYAATDGSTGNETILVNVATSQTLTINVSDGYSTPTVYNTGAGTVSVVSGQKSFSFTVSPAITGYEWRLYVDSGVGGELGTTALAGEETASSSSQSPAYTYTYSTDTDVVLQIIADGYEEFNGYYTLGNGNQSVTANLTVETNT